MSHKLTTTPWKPNTQQCSVCDAVGEELDKRECITQTCISDFAQIQNRLTKLQRESNKFSIRFVEKLLRIGRSYMDMKKKYWMDDEDWWYDTSNKFFVYFAQDDEREKCIRVKIPTDLLLSDNYYNDLDKCEEI